jgi:hypothetical protein
VGILAGRTKKNYSIRVRFAPMPSSPAQSTATLIGLRFSLIRPDGLWFTTYTRGVFSMNEWMDALLGATAG